MARRGGQIGNNNAAKGKAWEGAVRRVLAQDRERLHRIAQVVVECAERGEQWAVTEVRNTLDGRPHQTVAVDQTVTHVQAVSADELATKLAERFTQPAGTVAH